MFMLLDIHKLNVAPEKLESRLWRQNLYYSYRNKANWK